MDLVRMEEFTRFALPMKITLPGPMTITDSVVDQYYGNQKILGNVLAKLLTQR